ncbi:MAG: putative toxin-antitoxin system toxin component, PIN family [Eubacterium sp.]|jgi:putative PIN family toxin of toxin-antitoxin system|nr:putative toxin-antitoxin system toxin component, PIN family [Eubacterium sp.]
MRIVIDTNVLASGVFFGGAPRLVLEAISSRNIDAFATSEILEEYHKTIDRLMVKYGGQFNAEGLSRFQMMINLVDVHTKVTVCRDPDDDKFLGCALDSRAVYVVSGDKDLLTLKNYEGIEIITAREFCDRYLR